MTDLQALAADLHTRLASLSWAFSRRGRGLAFPWRGILGQTAEAKGSAINATIGVALEDAGSAMHLEGVTSPVDLAPDQIVAYAPGQGIAALRDAWAARQRRANPSLPPHATRPVVTAGLTHGLSVAGLLFCDDGDPLILPEPAWDNYELLFGVQHGAVLQAFPLFAGGAFNIEGMRARLSAAKDKAIVLLNFPNNPTGYTPRADEARAIRDLLVEAADRGCAIVVIIDDAYAGLVYEEGVLRESMFGLLADAHERILAVKIDGASKEDFAWGLRVAFLTFGCKGLTPDQALALEDKAAGGVRATVSNASRLSQELLLRSLQSPDDEKRRRELSEVLRERYGAAKRAFMNTKCDQHARLLPCNSGYFLCLELSAGLRAEDVRLQLLKKGIGTIALPGNLLRIAFAAVSAARMEELFTGIAEACAAKPA